MAKIKLEGKEGLKQVQSAERKELNATNCGNYTNVNENDCIELKMRDVEQLTNKMVKGYIKFIAYLELAFASWRF